MEINAILFWKVWKERVSQILNEKYKLFNNDKEWTKIIFYENTSIIDILRDTLKIPRTRPDYLVDCVFANSINLIYQNIDEFWPIERLILFEHENDIGTSVQELYKLLYSRAPLKVLVTYKFKNESDDTIYTKIVEYSKIISISNGWFLENESTEYLIIIGKRNERNNGLLWHAFIIDTKGNWKELQ